MITTEIFYKGYPLTVKKNDNGEVFINLRELSLALNYQDKARDRRSPHGAKSSIKCLGLDSVLIGGVVYAGEIEVYTLLNHSKLPERWDFLDFITGVLGNETVVSAKRYTKQRYKDIKEGKLDAEVLSSEPKVEYKNGFESFRNKDGVPSITFEEVVPVVQEVAVTEAVIEKEEMPNERVEFLLEKVKHLEEIIKIKDKVIETLEKVIG